MFVGEFKGADWRKQLGVRATKPEYTYNIKQVILDHMEMYRDLNPEALECKAGERVYRPTAIIEQELLLKQEKFGELSE